VNRRLLKSLSAVLICLLLVIPAEGQTKASPPAPTVSATDQLGDQELENKPLRGIDPDSKSAQARNTASGNAASGANDLSRIAVALAIVIGVILVLRSVVRHMTAMPGIGRTGKMVSVLSRSVVSPRQQVLVLQVGKRLLVVGDSAGRMNPLCEITDPDEIAMIVGQNRQSRDAMAEKNPRSFLSLFRRANEPFTETDALARTDSYNEKSLDPDEAVSSEEMNGLMDKVRMLQEQFRAKV
jgi:flagellar protein FliO/FliZ